MRWIGWKEVLMDFNSHPARHPSQIAFSAMLVIVDDCTILSRIDASTFGDQLLVRFKFVSHSSPLDLLRSLCLLGSLLNGLIKLLKAA